MPTDAYLNAFDSDPMAAYALHFALMYHWKGEAFRDLDFSQLGVNPALDDRLLALLAMMDEEGLPDAVDVKRCMAAYVQRVDPKQPVRGCGSCGEADVPAPLVRDAESVGILNFEEIDVADVRLRYSALAPAARTRCSHAWASAAVRRLRRESHRRHELSAG